MPYKKSELTPNLGVLDSADDIRGGMGIEGLTNLYQFVRDGGLVIVEGATSTIFPEYKLTPAVSVETPDSLFVRGSILRGIFADAKSPIAYGFDGNQLPVYFSQAPVLNVGGAAGGPGGGMGGFGAGAQIPGVGQNVSPNALNTQVLSPWQGGAPAPAAATGRVVGGPGAGEGGRGGFGAGLLPDAPRVILRFPQDPREMLLSGVLVGGQALSGKPQVIDAPIGKGHVVMFAIRPFWRAQTQGTYFLGFNAILNWNDLDAGKR